MAKTDQAPKQGVGQNLPALPWSGILPRDLVRRREAADEVVPDLTLEPAVQRILPKRWCQESVARLPSSALRWAVWHGLSAFRISAFSPPSSRATRRRSMSRFPPATAGRRWIGASSWPVRASGMSLTTTKRTAGRWRFQRPTTRPHSPTSTNTDWKTGTGAGPPRLPTRPVLRFEQHRLGVADCGLFRLERKPRRFAVDGHDG